MNRFSIEAPFLLPSRPRPRLREGSAGRPIAISLKESYGFLREVLRHPRAIGAIAQTSHRLAEALVQAADVARSSDIIELGAGAGAITRWILSVKPAQARVLAVERSPEYTSLLRERFPGLRVACGCVSQLGELAAAHDFPAADTVISALPWTNFSEAMQRDILSSVADLLVPGGVFTTIACAGLHVTARGRNFRHLLERRFPTVEASPVIWRNLPPAFLYRCSGVAARSPADTDSA